MTSTSWVLFPRIHLFEIEDQPWCPGWLREHSHRALARMWRTSNSKGGSPAVQASEILLRELGGPINASKYTFVDACAGAGGPTPLLEPAVNQRLQAAGRPPSKFILTDLWPDLKAWKKITARNSNITYIKEPIDATRPQRLTRSGAKECRIFNLCFHHFDDPGAQKVLASAVQTADAFMIFEMTHRTLPSLLNTSIVILSVFVTTLIEYYQSPFHLLLTYLIPVIPLFYVVDGYVSCFRGRTADETWALLHAQQDHLDVSGWDFTAGEQTALLPWGRMYWYCGVKREQRNLESI